MPASVSRSQSGLSVSSFSSAHSRDSVSRLGHGTVGESDLLSLSESIDNALFGVLFTIVKERYNTGLRFLLVKLALDFVQLFALVFKPSDGWVYDQNLWLWKWLRYLRFEDWLAPRGYAVFLAALYTMIGLMVVAVALSAWVAWCFRHRSFPAVWPIKLLRVYANIFFQTLDVATLTLLQLPFDCRWVGYPKELRNTFVVFPTVVCTDMPHVIHMAVAGFTLVLYLAMAIINLLADFELNPTTRNLYATANSTVEVRAFLIKFIMTVITYGIGWNRVHNVLLLLLAWYHTWMYLKWAPHLFAWVNHLRVGLYLCITGVALGGVVLAFHGEDNLKLRTRTTNVMLGLLAPLILLGGAVSYVRLEWWSKYVLMRYRTAAPGLKARRIYKFLDPKEVEIAARVCRKWTDQHFEVLDRQAAKEAEIIIKGGMQIFPSSAYLIIIYSNLLIDVMESTHTGYSQLQLARKCNPNFTERFAIFVREQEHMQRSAGAKSGESSVDLMSYVEYQRNHRLVMRAHRNALVSIRKFWQLLLHNQVAFTTLAKALMRIEKSVRVAEGIYKTTLERYPASPKLLRGYGKFLEAVKNNPWKAAKYFSEADKLREQQEQDEATMAVMDMGDGEPGSHMLNRVDERVSVVFLINSTGVIQMANKNACSLLGYGKGELESKNINIIMPPPYSQRHNRYLRQYVQTGRERVLSSVNTVLALHKARYVLPVKLAVSKVSGATEDSVFMGVLEPVAVDPNEAHLYLLPNGVVTAMDLPFYEWLGHELGDIIGKDVGALLQEAEGFKTALSTFDTSPSRKSISDGNPPMGQNSSIGRTLQTAPSGITTTGAPPTAASGQQPDHGSAALGQGKVLTEHVASAFFLHKYSQPVECSATMQRMGIGTECIVEVTLRRVGPPQMLVLTGASGRIKYISSELARALGTAPSALLRQPLGDIMPQPWGTLHEAWIRSHSSQAGPAQFMAPPGSCRTGVAMVLGASHRIQGYYRMAITSPEDPEESGTEAIQHVVQVHPSSREEALADRRLVLTVDADGIVTEVDDGPGWLFGFSPAQLLGRSLADCVVTLRPTGAGPDGAQAEEEDVSDLLGMLVTKAMQHGGCSWRVGVTPPMDEVELAALGPMRDAVVAKRTVAAVMEIEASLDTDAIGGAAGSGGSGANSKNDLRSADGGAKGASRPGTLDALTRQATEDSAIAGYRRGGRAAQTGGHAFTAPGYLNAEPVRSSVATNGGPAPGGDGPERPAPQRRARRSSWVAVETPGGGIMVVSGRKASGMEPQPGAAGNRAAPLSPDASAISFSARRPPRAVRMRAAGLGSDAAGGQVQSASGLQGAAVPGAEGTPIRTRSAGPFGLEPEASMVLEPLAPPGYRYPGAAMGETVGGSLHSSGFAAASAHTHGDGAAAGMATPSEQAPFALRGLDNTWGRSPFEAAQSSYGGGTTAGEQAAQRSPADLASGPVWDSAAAEYPTGTSTPGATAARPLAAAGSRVLSRQLTAELNARLVGSMLTAQASQEGPGAGPLLPGGNSAENNMSHVRSAMLAQLLKDNPKDLAGAVAAALNASNGSGFPARAASMRNRSGQGSEAFSRSASRCMSVRRQQEGANGGPQEEQLAGGDEEDEEDDLGGDARVVLLRVSLWRADMLTTVVEVDGNNKIASFVGEDLVPPGLVFGVLTSSLVSTSLPSLLDLPDRSVAGLFHDPGTARRGGLKTTAKQSNKVGALRQVCGRHADGHPLQLSMQAVVRESAPNRTYVVLKPRQPHKGSREALLASLQSQEVGLKLDVEEQADGSEELHGSFTRRLTGLSAEAEPAGDQTGALHGSAHRGAAFRNSGDWLPELRGSAEVRDRASLRRNSEESSCPPLMGDAPHRPMAVIRGDFRELAETTETHDRSSPRQFRSNGATWATPESQTPRAASPATPGLLGDHGRGHEADSVGAGGLAALRMLSEPGLPKDGTAGPGPAEPHPFAVLDGAAASLPLLRRHGSGAYDMSRQGSAGRAGGSSSGVGSRNLLSPRVRAPAGGSSGLACPPTAALAADHLHERPPPAQPDIRIGADRWSGSTLSAEGQLAGRNTPGQDVPSARRHAGVRRDSAYAEEKPHMADDASSEDWEVPAAIGRSRSVTFSASTRQRSAGAEALGEAKEAFSGSGASDDAGGRSGVRDAAAFAAGVERLSRGQEAAEHDGDGDSETSGVSGVSEGMAVGHQADYKRGKRYRKLLKVLTLPSVQRAATDFQWQALLANVAQLLANLIAFVLLTVLLRHEVKNIDGLVTSKRSIRLVHEMFINLQKLNNIYEGAVPAMGYYNTSDLPQLSADLLSRLDRFTVLHTDLYTSIKYNLRPDPSEPYDPTNEQDIWNKPIHNETVFYGVQPYRVEYVNTSLWDLVNRFIERTQEVQHTHDEWGPVHGTLSDMDAYRYCMTNGPSSVFAGYKDAMLARTMNAIEAAHEVNQLQLVMLVVQGGAVCVLLLLYMWWLQRRVSQQRYGMYSLFMILPVGLLRALASKSVTVMDDSDDGEESSDDDHEDRHPPPRNEQHSDTSQQHQHPMHLAPSPKLSQAGSSKAPKRSLSNLFKSRSRSGSNAKRRHLIPSNHESISLLTPFVVWGVLICVLYAVGYVLLSRAVLPLSLLSAHKSTVVRLHRLMLYSLRVGSEATDEGKAMLQPVLQHELREFEREWHVLLYGANSTARQDPRFQMCTVGTALGEEDLSHRIFRFSGCLPDTRAHVLSGPVQDTCRPTSSPFYAAITHGTYLMVERLMEDVAYLTRLPPANISINSTHLDYIMSEGEGNIDVGLTDIADSLLAEIRRLYALVSNLQICSLVLSWLLAVAFIFLQLRPFIARNRTETHRIARMLSELPADVDVETMVRRMLLRDGDGSGRRTSSTGMGREAAIGAASGSFGHLLTSAGGVGGANVLSPGKTGVGGTGAATGARQLGSPRKGFRGA